MSNAYAFYLAPLALAGVFVVGGVVALRKVARGEHKAKGRMYGAAERSLAALVLIAGAALGGLVLLTSPTPWQRQALFDHIFHTPPEQIAYVTLVPPASNYQPLVRSPVRITDRALLAQIAGALDRAVERSPNHPRSTWTVNVALATTAGQTYLFEVNAGPADSNGTLVWVYSGGARGWNLGTFRADDLEKPLEAAARTSSSSSGSLTSQPVHASDGK